MPTPNENETQAEFVSRCIPIVIEDETAADADQATAVCYQMWQDREKALPGAREYKTLEFKLTSVDPTGRTIEGYAAAFNNVDQGADVIYPGAFTKTLAERGNKVKLLWQHDRTEPIGKPLELREDANGLFIKAVISDTARGRDALALLRDGAIDGMSIGYEPIPGGTDYSRVGDKTIRNLREIKLYEASLVTFPMNEAAAVTALKAGRRMRRDKAEIVKNIRNLIDELAAWADYADVEPPEETPEGEKDNTAPATTAGRVAEGTPEKAGPGSAQTADAPPTWERDRLTLLETITKLQS